MPNSAPLPLPRRRLRLAFSDFWPGFDARANYFISLLATRFDVEISNDPEFLIYSVFGRRFLDFRCPRICYIGEPRSPNFYECDWALSFEPDSSGPGRNFRLPHYALYADPELLVRGPAFDAESVLRTKSRFCNFVYRRAEGTAGHNRRLRFFEKLSQYKRVDSGGLLANNVGGPVSDKLAFIRDHKFTIAFENVARPGYTTEKLLHPLQVASVPIYWGNPLVGRDFNPASFVDCRNFRMLDDVVEFIVSLDRDDALYLRFLREPPWPGDRPPDWLRQERLLDWFDQVFRHREPIRGSHPIRAAATRLVHRGQRDFSRRLEALRAGLGLGDHVD